MMKVLMNLVGAIVEVVMMSEVEDFIKEFKNNNNKEEDSVDLVQVSRQSEIDVKLNTMDVEIKELVGLRSRVDELENKIPEDDDELSEYAKAVFDSDQKKILPVVKSYRAARMAVGSGKVKELCEMFVSIFSNMCSRTREVEGIKVSNYKLTVGKHGFGQRWNIKSDPLTSYNDEAVFEIIANHEPIAKWLDANRMKPYGERLRRFAKFAVFLNSKSLAMFEDVPIDLSIVGGYGSRYKKVLKVKVKGGMFSAILDDGTRDNQPNTYTQSLASIEIYDDEDTKPYVRMHQPFGYLKLRVHWLNLLDEYGSMCEKIRVNAEAKMAELKDSFKREMTLIKM